MKEEKDKRKSMSLKAVCAVALAAFLSGAAAAGGIGYAVSGNQAEEVSSESADFQDYMETVLIPKFGQADLSGQTKTFTTDERWGAFSVRSGSRNVVWTGANGLAEEKICDLDDDGRQEMLVFLLEEEEIILRIFEEGEDGVYCAASRSWERPSETRESDLFWAVLRSDDITYLFFNDNYRESVRDFDFTNTGLYRYDGEKLYAPLEIKQTGGGSDRVMTAFQYDEDGGLLSEKIIYDENDANTPESRLAGYHGCISGLFYEYGLGLESEAALNGGRGGYFDLTKAKGYIPLLRLNMWIEEQTDGSDVYHFNELDNFNDLNNPRLTYQEFLYGEETARIREGVWYRYDEDKDVDKDREWTFRELMDMVRGCYLEGSGRWPYVEYAYLDCGGDGAEELAVRFVGIGIDGSMDDSDLTMVAACHGGKLEIVYAGESWCRSTMTLNYHGFVYSYGSSGAKCQGFGGEYIDENGDVQCVYTAEQNVYSVWDMKVRLEYDDRGEDDGSKYGALLTSYSIGDEDYSTLEFEEEASAQLCREYRDYLEEHGETIVTEEEIDGLIEGRAEELGVKREWMEEEELSWSYCSW